MIWLNCCHNYLKNQKNCKLYTMGERSVNTGLSPILLAKNNAKCNKKSKKLKKGVKEMEKRTIYKV